MVRRRQAIVWTNSDLLLIRQYSVKFQLTDEHFHSRNAIQNANCEARPILARLQYVKCLQIFWTYLRFDSSPQIHIWMISGAVHLTKCNKTSLSGINCRLLNDVIFKSIRIPSSQWIMILTLIWLYAMHMVRTTAQLYVAIFQDICKTTSGALSTWGTNVTKRVTLINQ